MCALSEAQTNRPKHVWLVFVRMGTARWVCKRLERQTAAKLEDGGRRARAFLGRLDKRGRGESRRGRSLSQAMSSPRAHLS